MVPGEPDRLATRGERTAGQMPRRPQINAVFRHMPTAGHHRVHNGSVQALESKQVAAEPAVSDGHIQKGAARQPVAVMRRNRGVPQASSALLVTCSPSLVDRDSSYQIPSKFT